MNFRLVLAPMSGAVYLPLESCIKYDLHSLKLMIILECQAFECII